MYNIKVILYGMCACVCTCVFVYVFVFVCFGIWPWIISDLLFVCSASHPLVTLDRSRASPLDVISRGVASLPHPQKPTEANQQPHGLLYSRRELKAVTTASQNFILAHLCSSEKARELRDLNAAFPCIPELETFRSVLDNKTWLDQQCDSLGTKKLYA